MHNITTTIITVTITTTIILSNFIDPNLLKCVYVVVFVYVKCKSQAAQ